MGKPYKYTREILAQAVAASTSVAGVLRYLELRPNGGTHAHISRTIKRFELDTSHFRRWGPRLGPPQRRTAADILVRQPTTSGRVKHPTLMHALLEMNVAYECAICGLDGTWEGQPLCLDIDHIDGDFHNNLIENLRFLCPNCHRQTPNFAGRSRGRYTRDHEHATA
jgi:hypothetical protein